MSTENPDSYLFPLESGKSVALTMNFPQHRASLSTMPIIVDRNTSENKILKSSSHHNHTRHDHRDCLDCMSTMFEQNHMPFVAFMHEFSDFVQNQKKIATQQTDLIETFLSYYQQQIPEKLELTELEIEHAFTYGTWSNGKIIGIILVTSSVYLATMRDGADPVIAFIRAYNSTKIEEFLYLPIVLVLSASGVSHIIAAIGYFSGLLGHSVDVIVLGSIFNLLGLLTSAMLASAVLFLSEQMILNFKIALNLNVRNFESDSSANSLSYSWTLLHRKYNCCFTGILTAGVTLPVNSHIFSTLHPGWIVPTSCCFSNTTTCVTDPMLNNSFVNTSCIEPASNHFSQLLSTFHLILLPIVCVIMICNICGIIYLMNLKTSIHRMNMNNDELAKTLFAFKSRHIAGIHGDIKKNPLKTIQQRKADENQSRKHHLHIPGYFPVTPTILQVRKPEQNTYLHYE